MNIVELIEGLRNRGIILWDNGDKLGYRAPKGSLTEDDIVTLRSRKDEVLAHLKLANSIRHDVEARFEPFPMTDIQQAYATGRHSGYELGGTGCHSYVELRMPQLDRKRLEAAWHKLIRRHDLLSAVVVPPDALRIVPHDNGPVLEEMDLRGHDPQRPDETYLRHRSDMEDRTYSLDSWPLHEFRLLQFDECSILQFSVDMIIADFVSVRVMVEELMLLYYGESLEPLPDATFRDIVISRATRRQTPAGLSEYESAKNYWMGVVGSVQEKASLPTDNTSREVDGPVRFTRRTWRCSAEHWTSLAARAGAYGVTPSSVLLTVYTDVIRRWSSSPDFCVNVTSMNRNQDIMGIDRIVGDFTEVTVHPCHPHPGPFIDRVRNNQHQLLEEFTHAALSGVEVLRELGRTKGESAVVPLVFTGALGAGVRHEDSQGLDIVYGVSRTPQVWIDCQTFEEGDVCNVNWDVREGVIPLPVLDDMWDSFTEALDRLATDESVWRTDDVVRLGVRTRTVRAQTRQTGVKRTSSTLQAGFWEQLRRRPRGTALVHEGRSLTYEDLAGYVQALDARLIGVGRGDRVAIILGRSIWQVAAVLAVLSRGAAYVPIDDDQPKARQHRMVSLCNPRMIVTDKTYCVESDETEVVEVDGLRPVPWTSDLPEPGPVDEPAYIIFTSGSSGTPKGVVMTHAAAMNTIADVNERFGELSARTVLGLSRLSFDLSVYDIFGTFASGGTLVLPTEAEAKDPSAWMRLMSDTGVNTWNSVPALFQMLVQEHEAAGLPPNTDLRLALISGDLIPRTLPKRSTPFFPRAQLVSLGGATEAGIWSIYHVMTGHTGETSIPYGKALTNQCVYVLDEFLNECPDEVKGRIHISGESLASEYLDDPEKTAQKFFASHHQKSRLYDTGDIGSYGRDGIIEFHGRADSQIKINGYRVETGEIEAVLEEHESVGRAAVIAEDANGRKRLRAYVTPAPERTRPAIGGASDTPEALERLGRALDERWAQDGAARAFDAATYAAWMEAGKEASLAALLAAFIETGLFIEPDCHYGGAGNGDIVARLGPVPEYQQLPERWLEILVAEDVLRLDEHGYSITQDKLSYFRMDERWDHFATLENQIRNSSALFEYQRHVANTLLKQIRGEVDPLNLFFPGGQTDNARAIYGENKISSTINEAVAEAVASIVETYGEHPVRILEIGAGVGATTEHILPKLPGTIAEYRFTDISPFFLRNAKRVYHDYSFMTYGLFDINVDCDKQDVDLNAYDLIICANVLHNANNIDEGLSRLQRLRRSDGAVLFVEPVTELYAALISISIKMNLVNFTDLRSGTHKVFIDDSQWDEVISAAGLKKIAEFPAVGDPLRECGQRLFVTGGNDSSRINAERLSKYLSENLPEYMIPVSIRLMDELPLSPNGKIDRKAIAQLLDEQVLESRVLSLPQSPLESEIAAVWCNVLEVEGLDRDDDFYSVGGDSLLMAQAVTQMRQEVAALKDLSWDFIMRELLKHPTVAGIAAAAEAAAKVEEKSADPTDSQRMHVYAIPESSTSCRAVFHAGTGRVKDYEYLLPALMEKDPQIAHVGLTSGDADEYLSSSTTSLIAERARLYAQDLMSLNMDSYELIGYCIGGFFAIETAKILTELGRNVSRVVAISTHLCPHRIANELLCEFAYGCVLEADLEALGVTFDIDQLRDGLNHIIDGVNRDITDDELCALDGRYASIGAFFTELSSASPRHRRRRIYQAIKEIDGKSDVSRAMLEILYDVFRHSLRGTIGYVPDVYLGNVLVLQPELGVDGFYPSLGGDVDWPGTVLGTLEKDVIRGSHATCLSSANYRSVLRYFS